MSKRLSFLMLLITACIFWSCKPEVIDTISDGGIGGEIIGGVDSVLQVHTITASYVWSTSAVLGGNMSINTLSGISEVGIMYLPTGGSNVDSLYFESHPDDAVKMSASMGKSWSIAVSGLSEETEYAY